MARARVKFSSSGASGIISAFSKVGAGAQASSSRVGKAGAGIGGFFFKIMRNVGRLTMFSAGVQDMGKSAIGAEKNIKKFGAGTVTALSAVSKKFAELRRTYYFFKFTGEKLAAPLKWVKGGKTKEKDQTKAEEKGKPSRWLDRAGASAETSAAKVAVATTAWQKFLQVISGGVSNIGKIIGKIFKLKNILIVLGTSFGLISVAGGAAFTYIGYKAAVFAKRLLVDFMQIRETFRLYEISLGGIIKNTHALGKVMNFATTYAAEYPAMFEEVLDTFRSLAALPALKPMFRRADEQDLKKIMDVIQGLATLDPIQGVKGAGIALREALSGDMRSVRRRFEISAHAIAEAGGYAMEEITKDSEKALNAFDAFIKLNVPAKSMADAAMVIAIQTGNLRDKYRVFTNDIMKSTGAYWAVVSALKNLNNWLQKVFESSIIKKWAADAGTNIRAFVDTLKSTMSGIDWKKYIDSGDLATGLVQGAIRFVAFLETMTEKISAPFLDAVAKISKILWKGLIPIAGMIIKSFGIIFVEGMKAAAKSAATAFAEGIGSGEAFKNIASFILDTMASIGKVAGKGFMLAFVGALNISGAIFDKTSEGYKILADKAAANWGESDTITVFMRKMGDIFKTAADAYKPKTMKGIADAIIDSSEIDKKVKDTKKSLDVLKKEILDDFVKFAAEDKPEIVTPELTVKEHQLNVKDLQQQLTAMEQINVPIEKRKATIEALTAAEDKLNRALRLRDWESGIGKSLSMMQKQLSIMDKTRAAALEAGIAMDTAFYSTKMAIQGVVNNLKNLYNRFVDQKSTSAELFAMIRKGPEKMKAWTETYTIGKKDATGLLLVVKKLNDIITGKTVVKKPEEYFDLLKERIKLTDINIKKEKQYQKQIGQISKKLSGMFAQVSASIATSVMSFVGKWGAELGAFGVSGKVAKKLMVPEDMFGGGEAGLTYGRGMKKRKGIPYFLEYMLSGARGAMERAEEPKARKVLAGMQVGLLEKQIGYTKKGSSERANLLAEMAGAQANFLKETVNAAKKDVKLQTQQLDALKQTAANTAEAISASERVIAAIRSIEVSPVVTMKPSPQSRIQKPVTAFLNPSITPEAA
jgi:hypothetical protein